MLNAFQREVPRIIVHRVVRLDGGSQRSQPAPAEGDEDACDKQRDDDDRAARTRVGNLAGADADASAPGRIETVAHRSARAAAAETKQAEPTLPGASWHVAITAGTLSRGRICYHV